jgi:pyruvate dehydrogenase E2 component (dihydrolipoamide acetyltransferase)
VVDLLYPITVPKWGIEMQEGTITGWQVEPGATVAKGDELIDIETDKIVNTMEAPVDGVVCRQLVDEGETLKVGELLGVIATGDAADDEIAAFIRDFVPADASFGIDDEDTAGPAAAAGARPAEAASGDSDAAPAGEIRVSPVARRIAKKLGVDLSQVKGTGRNGRISREDVEAAAAQVRTPDAAIGAEVTPLSSRRQTIARRLTAAKQEIPHYYLTRSIEMAAALARKTETESLNAIIIAAVAKALGDHPGINCHVVESGVIQRQSIDVNMAVDTEQGLSAPLIRNVDSLSLSELTKASVELAERARANQLAAEDLEPGGFTVSNLGALGIESFTAIINPPQAAILAIGTIVDGRMKVTMSCDHRVIDGAVGARFLKTLASELAK